MTKRLLRYHDLKERQIVNNRVTLNDWVKKGIFPPGFQLGERTRAWTEESIDEWLASRKVGPLPAIGGRRAA